MERIPLSLSLDLSLPICRFHASPDRLACHRLTWVPLYNNRKRLGCGSSQERPHFESQLCHFLAVGPGVNYLAQVVSIVMLIVVMQVYSLYLQELHFILKPCEKVTSLEWRGSRKLDLELFFPQSFYPQEDMIDTRGRIDLIEMGKDYHLLTYAPRTKIFKHCKQ